MACALPVICLALSVLAACPSNPPRATLIETDGSVPLADAIDAPEKLADAAAPLDGTNAIALGFPDPLPGTQAMDGNDLIGVPLKIAASQAGELVGWGARASAAPGAQVRMAIYSHSTAMNQPAALLVQSGVWTLADEVLPASGFLLNAGDYWVLVSVSDSVSIGQSTATPAESRECFAALQFAVAFPDPWGSGTCFVANPINVFILIRPTT
jgi:hypothetical protein